MRTQHGTCIMEEIIVDGGYGMMPEWKPDRIALKVWF